MLKNHQAVIDLFTPVIEAADGDGIILIDDESAGNLATNLAHGLEDAGGWSPTVKPADLLPRSYGVSQHGPTLNHYHRYRPEQMRERFPQLEAVWNLPNFTSAVLTFNHQGETTVRITALPLISAAT